MCSERGQTLMELIVVISVSVIVISALVFATISSLRNAQFAKNQAQATKLAQEGIERARVGRDRDKNITLVIGTNTITSWNGNNTDCPANTGSIWCNQISGSCGIPIAVPPTFCYFNVTAQSVLNYLTVSSSIPTLAEPIPPSPANAIFHRAIILSDETLTFTSQKTVTSVVTWSDFSGDHESRLTTILRKK